MLLPSNPSIMLKRVARAVTYPNVRKMSTGIYTEEVNAMWNYSKSATIAVYAVPASLTVGFGYILSKQIPKMIPAFDNCDNQIKGVISYAIMASPYVTFPMAYIMYKHSWPAYPIVFTEDTAVKSIVKLPNAPGPRKGYTIHIRDAPNTFYKHIFVHTTKLVASGVITTSLLFAGVIGSVANFYLAKYVYEHFTSNDDE